MTGSSGYAGGAFPGGERYGEGVIVRTEDVVGRGGGGAGAGCAVVPNGVVANGGGGVGVGGSAFGNGDALGRAGELERDGDVGVSGGMVRFSWDMLLSGSFMRVRRSFASCRMEFRDARGCFEPSVCA